MIYLAPADAFLAEISALFFLSSVSFFLTRRSHLPFSSCPHPSPVPFDPRPSSNRYLIHTICETILGSSYRCHAYPCKLLRQRESVGMYSFPESTIARATPSLPPPFPTLGPCASCWSNQPSASPARVRQPLSPSPTQLSLCPNSCAALVAHRVPLTALSYIRPPRSWRRLRFDECLNDLTPLSLATRRRV
jgi:hypothetical protein